jgi:hypothetical protein
VPASRSASGSTGGHPRSAAAESACSEHGRPPRGRPSAPEEARGEKGRRRFGIPPERVRNTGIPRHPEGNNDARVTNEKGSREDGSMHEHGARRPKRLENHSCAITYTERRSRPANQGTTSAVTRRACGNTVQDRARTVERDNIPGGTMCNRNDDQKKGPERVQPHVATGSRRSGPSDVHRCAAGYPHVDERTTARCHAMPCAGNRSARLST